MRLQPHFVKQQELVINALKQCMRMCKDDPRTLETLLLTCGQLGRTSEHEAFLEVILVSLMPYVASTSLRLRAVAWAEMAGSARCRGILSSARPV
ncbi:hypothetical protein SARC_06104 [Sphaeroforma arctica JP610]|uniref:Uncharacterized protein n=1 Tax=Sphaeroforma arctica JP610 TaxID=667725 RepID=A0A0L0FXN5_9EUKA|nr:hypothetical protein SARC_06104 [Sphaeroforma arctica JP610]KNC81585.1 hypothetical protein SARC_06104 [Sphaeroforma arctica JP610]|eukprot:XP_014155487.1 hypothetical protein SARC_06104 [Sphaeroforma arctica JP610]